MKRALKRFVNVAMHIYSVPLTMIKKKSRNFLLLMSGSTLGSFLEKPLF